MEYEVTIRVKVDPSFFYWDLTTLERQKTIADTICNAVHDTDDIRVTNVRSEELEL